MATWTPEEDKILLELYETAPREDILAKLPNRVWKSIYKRSVILRLSRPKDDAWKKEDDDRLRELYPNTAWDLLVPQFPGRTRKAIGWHAINILRLTRNPEITQEENRKTNLVRRGVEYPTQSAEVRDKVIQTVRERYGVDNVFQSEDIKKKMRETNLEKLGVENPNHSSTIREKSRQTNLERYGVDNPFQMIDRVKHGMAEKHGHDSPQKVPEIREKTIQTNLERYGVPAPAQNKTVLEKGIQTSKDNHGGIHHTKCSDVKKKIIKTNLKRYGFTNPAMSDGVKDKVKATTYERYGVQSFLQLKEIRDKGVAVMKKNKSFCKSKGEISFIEYLKLFDPDTSHLVEHPIIHNMMDYYLPHFDLWCQFDGDYWHGRISRINVTRQSLKIKKTMDRDAFQNSNIPNLIRFWESDVKQAIKDDTIFALIETKIKEKISIAHQYIKKIEFHKEDLETLEFNPEEITVSDFVLSNEALSQEIVDFILRYEWLGTVGVMPKWCFTARLNEKLGGVVLLNEPTSYSKILGDNTKQYEALIQRGATASWTPKNLGSRMIMFSCRWMVQNTEKRAFVAYADPQANELGIIYQACNFDYIGNNFGTTHLFKHPDVKGGDKWFSPQSLKRTSAFKRWCKNNGVKIKSEWFNENGFKNLDIIPKDIKDAWYGWNREVLSESERLKVDKKHKYVLLMGKNKRESKFLNSLKTYESLPYPKK
jgi:hypothetical protein